ncbi:hypothetical protein BCR42DRAFT_414618 [Absidia repens]|uniref:Uncharacterized protein n=1 Tax=Absidia repens TaxID=90262 RepID=A0A1X2IGK5_9FUNG|nr:hypothetical protein BCR42DRAFT_414618 [Absidia repens]
MGTLFYYISNKNKSILFSYFLCPSIHTLFCTCSHIVFMIIILIIRLFFFLCTEIFETIARSC